MARRKKQKHDTENKVVQAPIDVTALQGLLPANQKFQFNEELRIISILQIEPAEILAQVQLSPNEWCVFKALRTSHPNYASYEELLACLTSLSFADCRRKILEAQEVGAQEVSRELKPVQRAIYRTRKKLRKAVPYLEISFIPDGGYGLATTERIHPDAEEILTGKTP